MADVFVSYKRADRPRIEPIVGLLEDAGLTVWWDPDLVAGERFGDVIAREIECARCVVVAWSASSIGADWVRDEAAAGRDRGILVPLRLDDVTPPLGFRQLQTPDLSDWSGDPDDPRIEQLTAGITRAVQGGGMPQLAPMAVPDVRQDLADPPQRLSRPRRLSRRRVLSVGAAGVALGGGWWLGAPVFQRASVPVRRTEQVDAVTVDARGDAAPPQRTTVEVFDLPVGRTTMAFSAIPAGGFQVGSPDGEAERLPIEGPQQLVELSSFAVGRTAVTQAQWAALVEAAPEPIGQSLRPYPSSFRGDDLPVETVTWYQAVEFCARLSRLSGLRVRLPSETEWEYACRAHTASAFHFGPTLTAELANYCGTGGAVRGTNNGVDIGGPAYGPRTYDSGAYAGGPAGVFLGRTVAVRTYPPNGFGLHEMHGNVWEHCADVGPVDYREAPTDGRPAVGPQGSRVLRGGSWSHNPAICRAAYRDSMRPDWPGWEGRVGLRVVCELEPS
ncbi:SUMF1/EgtB/PvdO family nonheme iron enzyme [Pseudonocardia charpentierae]|uniref:SUMF1/EgtB/PvdO family nonheme iron enzyme n=1 Tax=Pseudonocardia charpentierae TaxID=3075545 RepID=A0ABU2NB82_9PSEU|nr:SUMF1/EgtB/PvdO family nonheme iron enzyme [Pseudonocardia sp. DSM 45834]MDT0351216.1 SUMF1/EgtB/PvdO family nonheme iron enzyme [Pseudonocardia sp. DSM 45834]